ncbi:MULTISPECIES: TetR/AcrR family transcriptional regulator [unclassified Streptomyces]|uniref:TetR/AcrR family transcriptional regulator n=1 Tax=unclassified Streptomyces TaxID=2593676 RepID=UPI0033E0CC4D
MTTNTGGKPRLDSIWLSGPARRRPQTSGSHPALSRDQIVSAAVQILDTEGLGALSMRRLATDLGVAAMSLYWHVPTKDALLEFALDEIFGRLDRAPKPDADWGRQAEHIAHDLRRVIREHPWSSQLAGTYAMVGPHALAMFETLIGLVEQGGFAPPHAYRAVGTLVNYVLGFAADEVKWLSRMREAALDPEEVKSLWLPPMLEAVGDQFPRMRANLEAGESRDWDDHFSFGLSCMVDGMRIKAGETD